MTQIIGTPTGILSGTPMLLELNYKNMLQLGQSYGYSAPRYVLSYDWNTATWKDLGNGQTNDVPAAKEGTAAPKGPIDAVLRVGTAVVSFELWPVETSSGVLDLEVPFEPRAFVASVDLSNALSTLPGLIQDFQVQVTDIVQAGQAQVQANQTALESLDGIADSLTAALTAFSTDSAALLQGVAESNNTALDEVLDTFATERAAALQTLQTQAQTLINTTQATVNALTANLGTQQTNALSVLTGQIQNALDTAVQSAQELLATNQADLNALMTSMQAQAGNLRSRGNWSAGTYYYPLNIVRYQTGTYIAKAEHQGQNPISFPEFWDLIAQDSGGGSTANLPTASAADAGKAVVVSEAGTYVLGTVQGVGSGLPESTDADAGKVLMVTEGAGPAWVTLVNTVSWGDIQDKPALVVPGDLTPLQEAIADLQAAPSGNPYSPNHKVPLEPLTQSTVDAPLGYAGHNAADTNTFHFFNLYEVDFTQEITGISGPLPGLAGLACEFQIWHLGEGGSINAQAKIAAVGLVPPGNDLSVTFDPPVQLFAGERYMIGVSINAGTGTHFNPTYTIDPLTYETLHLVNQNIYYSASGQGVDRAPSSYSSYAGAPAGTGRWTFTFTATAEGEGIVGNLPVSRLKHDTAEVGQAVVMTADGPAWAVLSLTQDQRIPDAVPGTYLAKSLGDSGTAWEALPIPETSGASDSVTVTRVSSGALIYEDYAAGDPLEADITQDVAVVDGALEAVIPSGQTFREGRAIWNNTQGDVTIKAVCNKGAGLLFNRRADGTYFRAVWQGDGHIVIYNHGGGVVGNGQYDHSALTVFKTFAVVISGNTFKVYLDGTLLYDRTGLDMAQGTGLGVTAFKQTTDGSNGRVKSIEVTAGAAKFSAAPGYAWVVSPDLVSGVNQPRVILGSAQIAYAVDTATGTVLKSVYVRNGDTWEITENLTM